MVMSPCTAIPTTLHPIEGDQDSASVLPPPNESPMREMAPRPNVLMARRDALNTMANRVRSFGAFLGTGVGSMS